MRASNPKSYLLGSKMQEGTSAINTQSYIKHTSLCTVKYTQKDKGAKAA